MLSSPEMLIMSALSSFILDTTLFVMVIFFEKSNLNNVDVIFHVNMFRYAHDIDQ